MLNYGRFLAIFPSEGSVPYDQRGIQEIDTLRRSLDGVLFIDRVLKALGIGEGNAYPPRGASGLRGLHQQVCESRVSAHQKLSVFYYLLLDYDGFRGSKSNLAEEFAAKSGLPKKYQILMRGLWHMDRKEFKFALEYLTHPSLPAEFADEIVTILARHAKDGNFSLPLAYYHAAQPVFKTSEALDLLFGALARTSVTEALYFSRNHPESTRQLLFDRLIVSVLDGQVGSTRHKELVSLPFDRAEEDWFHNYLTEGDGKRLKSAAATVETRRIITGRHRGQVRLRDLEDNSVTARSTRPKPIR